MFMNGEEPPIPAEVALLAEGVDRNWLGLWTVSPQSRSPSSRRAWIEIYALRRMSAARLSPSSRRAWIEIAGARP